MAGRHFGQIVASAHKPIILTTNEDSYYLKRSIFVVIYLSTYLGEGVNTIKFLHPYLSSFFFNAARHENNEQIRVLLNESHTAHHLEKKLVVDKSSLPRKKYGVECR